MNYKEEVERIVSESTDMITALESIGPMYGIPSTNMLVENTGTKSLRVVGDHIITPPDVKPNTKAIVCAIGGVLDHISQRVDDKINQYQLSGINKGKIEDHIKRDANPSKGKVIARYVDPNGDEILAYDSGLVDMKNTPQSIAMVTQLRNDMKIPMYNPNAMSRKTTYFTDEDDISVDDPKPEKVNTDRDTIDYSKITNESALILDMISHFDDTTHLGYDWLQEQGFDFVKPVDTFVQEATEEVPSKPIIKSSEVKHMKFDNSHILKAIDYFNKARDEQKDKESGSWDVRAFIESPYYKKAISELDKQFDCRINIRFFNDSSGRGRNDLITPVMDNIKQNMHISKSKGFQLHGAPIDIFVVNKALDEEMGKSANQKLFGQFVCASLCHEIFHNIVSVIRHNNYTFNFALMSALTLASSAPNAKSRRITFEKYVKSLESQGIKMSRGQRKKLVKELCYVSTMSDNEKTLNSLRHKLENVETTAEADKEISKYIKALEVIDNAYTDLEKKSIKAKKNKKLYKTMHIIGTILTCTGIGAIVGVPMMLSGTEDPLKDQERYMKSTNKEEYYCDLFAGIYQLPLSFMMGFKNRSFTINQIPEARLNRIANLEKRVSQFGQSTYPTLSERNYAAMTIAKSILDNKEDVAPQIREYCEWIVSNYSNILTTDIGSNYNSVTFDPTEAQNLDKHIQRLIDNNDIPVTESYIGKFRDVIMFDMSDDTLNDEISEVMYLGEAYINQIKLMHSSSHVYQEGKLGNKWNQFKADSKADPIEGKSGETLLKKVLMFIPRILNVIAQSILRLFNMNDVNSLVKDMENLQKQIEELSKSEEKNKENIKTLAKHIVNLHNKVNTGTNLDDERYKSIRDSIEAMYKDIQDLGLVKADKSVQAEQMRSVLTLAGYVLYTFDLTAYKKFITEFESVLKKMDSINLSNIESINNFSAYNVSNIYNELDQFKGHYVYDIKDFNRYAVEVNDMHKKVAGHCKSLIDKFNKMNHQSYDRSIVVTANIEQFLTKLKDIMEKLTNTKRWYTEDFNKIRNSINDHRNSITKLSETNIASYEYIREGINDQIDMEFVTTDDIKLISKEYPNATNILVGRPDAFREDNPSINKTIRNKLNHIDTKSIYKCLIVAVYINDENSHFTLIHYNKLSDKLKKMLDENEGLIIFEK